MASTGQIQVICICLQPLTFQSTITFYGLQDKTRVGTYHLRLALQRASITRHGKPWVAVASAAIFLCIPNSPNIW